MTSFDLSASYNITQENSLTTLNLFTEEKPLSLIDQLNSDGSSSLSPQVLFEARPFLDAKEANSQEIECEKQSDKKYDALCRNLGSRCSLVNSFQVEDDASSSFKIRGPRQSSKDRTFDHYAYIYNETVSNNDPALFRNKCPMHFTLSRNIEQPISADRTKGRSQGGLVYFEQQVENLKENVERLKIAIDRASTNEKSKDSEGYVKEDRKPVNRALVYDSLSSQNVISKLDARSTQSQEMTRSPQRQHIEVKGFDLGDLSPILCQSPEQEVSNTDDKSTKRLIMRKLARRNNGNTA